MKMIDLTGHVYGRLTVINEADRRGNKRYWICRCECDTETVVQMSQLRNGRIKSCGCLRAERASDTHAYKLADKQFGRLTALEVVDRHPERMVNIWSCECKCGNTITVRADHLVQQEVRSCGCLKKDQDTINMTEALQSRYVDGAATHLLTQKLRENSTSGHKGVIWAKREAKWHARITIKGRRIHLGYFDDLDSAIIARKDAEDKYFQPYLEGKE